MNNSRKLSLQTQLNYIQTQNISKFNDKKRYFRSKIFEKKVLNRNKYLIRLKFIVNIPHDKRIYGLKMFRPAGESDSDSNSDFDFGNDRVNN